MDLKCEKYFQLDETPEEWKVTMASLHLDEKAFSWHQALKRKLGETLTWADYVEVLKVQFGPSYEAPMEDLMKLRQTGSLDDFNDDFDAIVYKLRLPEDYLVQASVAGLDEDFAAQVRILKPRSLQEARSIATIHEVNLRRAGDTRKGNES